MDVKKDYGNIIMIGLIAVIVGVVVFNAIQISKLDVKEAGVTRGVVSDVIDVIPKGVPDIYGKELGVSFDDISTVDAKKSDLTIGKLGQLDMSISLSGKELEKYINIASQISCEYCCGAQSIIFKNGEAACGCAHSYAMRGLAKYLIKYHSSEYSNDEILEELGKWKTLFFPGIIAKKAQVLSEKGIELNYINLASNKYRGIENR